MHIGLKSGKKVEAIGSSPHLLKKPDPPRGVPPSNLKIVDLVEKVDFLVDLSALKK